MSGGVWIAEVKDDKGVSIVEKHPNTGQTAKDVWQHVRDKHSSGSISVTFEAKPEARSGVWIAEVTDERNCFWFEVYKDIGQSAKEIWQLVRKEEPEARITVLHAESKEKYLAEHYK